MPIPQAMPDRRHPAPSAHKLGEGFSPLDGPIQDDDLRDACLGETPGHRARSPASSKDHNLPPSRHEAGLLLKRPEKSLPVSVGPEQTPTSANDGIDRANGGGLR